MDLVKLMIVGSPLGAVAGAARDRARMLRAAYFDRETVGTIANDQLAMLIVTRLCRPNEVFVDVGAHVGSIVAEVARHDASVRIIAIEAVPAKAALLRKKFPSIELHDCAVGEVEGTATFFVDVKQSAYSALGQPAGDRATEINEIRVDVKRLDGLLASGGIDVIKIDVVGAELGVLRGGRSLISSDRPTILFESGAPVDDGLGYKKEDLWGWFAEHDYEVVVPNRLAHEGPSLTLEGFTESHWYPRRTTNYFGIPRERRNEMRDRARQILGVTIGDGLAFQAAASATMR